MLYKARIYIGLVMRAFGKWIQPDYWKCTYCGYIDTHEHEVLCWRCGSGKGEMIYKGE